MARFVATIPLAVANAGKVFALVHPGGILSSPFAPMRLGLNGGQDVEIRIRISRHSTKAAGGTLRASSPMADGGSAAKLEIRTDSVSWPSDEPQIAVPDICRTRGARGEASLFENGHFTIAPNRTIVVETLDPIPSAAVHPLTFVLIWEE